MFEFHLNSFFTGTLLEREDLTRSTIREISTPPQLRSVKTLSSIPMLYQYTSVPPLGLGTQAPYTLESVLRAKEYNKNQDDKIILLEPYQIQNPVIHDEDKFDFEGINGNFHLRSYVYMCKNFLRAHFPIISECVDATIEKATKMPSDVLTWCPIQERSVPAADAYMTMCEFYKHNLNKTPGTQLDWIRMFFDCCKATELKVPTHEWIEVKKKKYCKETKSFRVIIKRKRKTKWTKIVGRRTCFLKMMDYARSFCSYIKHKERGRLNRRAIASPSMILRMFFYIIEDMHLELSRRLEESTISIGGDDKKRRLINMYTGFKITAEKPIYLQATEDATKWNECLSPALFATIAKVFFDEDIRDELGLPLPNDSHRLFQKLCLSAHFILSTKRIIIGEAPQGIDGNEYNRPSWTPTNINRMSPRYKNWLTGNWQLVEEEKYIFASSGMLMAMHNALSTTAGIIPKYGITQHPGMRLATIRSSDDSMTLFGGETQMHCEEVMQNHYKMLKLAGINISAAKIRIQMIKFGEFTSWYIDGNLTSNYGVEVSKLRPQAHSPHDDYNSISMSAHTCLSQLEVNLIGAECMLPVGVANVSRLWGVKYQPNKRPGLNEDVLLLADGGKSPWCATRCGFDEITIKKDLCTTDLDRSYFYKIMNPDCPLIQEVEEEATYSKDTGMITGTLPEVPRDAFCFKKRSNRTAQTEYALRNQDRERNHQEALKVAQNVDLSLCLSTPSSKTPIAEHLVHVIEAHKRCLKDLTPEEEEEVLRAICILKGSDEDMDEIGDVSVEDV